MTGIEPVDFDDRPSPIQAIRAVEEALAKEPPPAAATEANYPERVKIMLDGAALTSGPRDGTYGRPQFNMACSAALKEVFWTFQAQSARRMTLAEREAIDMVLTKLGRIATGPKVHRDNYVDGSTYFAIAGESAQDQEHPVISILKDKF